MNTFWAGFEKQANKHHRKRIDSAIARRGMVHVTYRKANGRTVKRKVSPYEVKGDLMIGHDHHRDEIRSYRLDRMKHVKKAELLGGPTKAAPGASTKAKLLGLLIPLAGAAGGAAGGYASPLNPPGASDERKKKSALFGGAAGLGLGLGGYRKFLKQVAQDEEAAREGVRAAQAAASSDQFRRMKETFETGKPYNILGGLFDT